MKAVVMRGFGPDAFQIEDRPKPAPRKGEIRVRVAACGANASDWEFATGRPLYGRIARTLMRVQVAGSDVAGTVDAVGDGVTMFKPGDRVLGDTFETFGGFAEFCCAKADRFIPLPEDNDFINAAALPQSGAIAIAAFDTGLPKDAKVLINGGGGGAGPLAIQLAKARGATVFAVDNASKQTVMQQAGADHTLDYRATDFLTLNQSFDYILDLVATRPLRAVRQKLADKGQYRLVGGHTALLLAAALPPPNSGILMVPQGPQATAQALDLARKGTLSPLIGETSTLEMAPAALTRMGEGAIPGKLVITI